MSSSFQYEKESYSSSSLLKCDRLDSCRVISLLHPVHTALLNRYFMAVTTERFYCISTCFFVLLSLSGLYCFDWFDYCFFTLQSSTILHTDSEDDKLSGLPSAISSVEVRDKGGMFFNCLCALLVPQAVMKWCRSLLSIAPCGVAQ